MTTIDADGGISFGRRIRQLAEEKADEVAVFFALEDGGERQVTWNEVDEGSTRLAHVMKDRGIVQGDWISIALRNSPEHLMCCFAGWKLGAVVVPMRWDLPAWERDRVLETVSPKLVIDSTSTDLFEAASSAPTAPLDDVISPNGWGVCSSGSTGTPKVILMNHPGIFDPRVPVNSVVESWVPLTDPQIHLVPAPLYHTNGFLATQTLMMGVPIVLMERFNPERVLELIEQHRITGFVAATPMLQRLAQVADVGDRDLSSVTWVQQGASPLPVWLGRRWCELIGPESLYLSYGASERHGLIVCRGDEWLTHPGTLGRGAFDTEVRILDLDGNELPAGEIGGIYMRTPTGPAASYRGDHVSPIVMTEDGFATVGDMGWMNEEGYVYLADRRVDMVVTGGSNVFPAEVESALSEHPGIADVVVIGLKDEEWGHRVHAIVQQMAESSPLTEGEIVAYAKERLASYKVPKSVEFIDRIPRSEAMKLNRATLVAERDVADAAP